MEEEDLEGTCVDEANPGYIARMKREQQEREQQEQLAQSSTGDDDSGAATEYSSTGSYNPRGRGASKYRGGSSRGRGGFSPYRGGSPRGRGASYYHPYQRPPPTYSAPRFQNRSVVFNKPEPSADASKDESTSGPSSALPSAAHSREHSQVPPEPTQLCATFTSTGTPETIATLPCLPIYVYV